MTIVGLFLRIGRCCSSVEQGDRHGVNHKGSQSELAFPLPGMCSLLGRGGCRTSPSHPERHRAEGQQWPGGAGRNQWRRKGGSTGMHSGSPTPATTVVAASENNIEQSPTSRLCRADGTTGS